MGDNGHDGILIEDANQIGGRLYKLRNGGRLLAEAALFLAHTASDSSGESYVLEAQCQRGVMGRAAGGERWSEIRRHPSSLPDGAPAARNLDETKNGR